MMNEVEPLYIVMNIPPHDANAGVDADEHYEDRLQTLGELMEAQSEAGGSHTQRLFNTLEKHIVWVCETDPIQSEADRSGKSVDITHCSG